MLSRTDRNESIAFLLEALLPTAACGTSRKRPERGVAVDGSIESWHHTPSLTSKLCQKLVTQVKGHSLFPRSCPSTMSKPSESFGCKECKSNIACKHARKYEACPLRVKKYLPSRLKRFWFYLCWRKQRGWLQAQRNAWYSLICLLQTYCHLSTNKKRPVSWWFS